MSATSERATIREMRGIARAGFAFVSSRPRTLASQRPSPRRPPSSGAAKSSSATRFVATPPASGANDSATRVRGASHQSSALPPHSSPQQSRSAWTMFAGRTRRTEISARGTRAARTATAAPSPSPPSARPRSSHAIADFGFGMRSATAFVEAKSTSPFGNSIAGAAKRSSANSASRRSAAGFISAQWNGALTGSFFARMRFSAARAMASSTAAASPDTTVCVGQL